MTTQMPLNKPPRTPYKLAAVGLLLVLAVITCLVFFQFRGDFTPKTKLTMLSGRAGLVMDPGTPVTFNGVQIGRVAGIDEVQRDGAPAAKLTLDVNPADVNLIPVNVTADIKATTVFGNKFVSLSLPKDPSKQRITSRDVIDARSVTTEFNTVFQTVLSLTQKVDPVKLNKTLTAAAQALDGQGDRFGQAIVEGNDILGELNPRMPQIRADVRGLADTAAILADASPNIFNALQNGVTTARTINDMQGDLDQALMAAVGFGNTGGDVIERGQPYLTRLLQDLLPTTSLLDEYSPALFCTIRNFHDVAPKIEASFGGSNGYSLRTRSEILGAGNPYVFPDNLPRVNASGGPEGKPGCWAPVTRDLWPAPYLVMDTGASIAPYNHFGLGQPIAIEYVWGRQFGENTINP